MNPTVKDRSALTVGRMRVAAMCAVLCGLAFLTEPGRIVADTKIDLVLNPMGLLQRSLHMWDPTGSFGQVPNQAYGYLWPMGPFFAAGSAVGLPAWLVQRLWWALVMCVAATGLVALARRLGIGTSGSQILAGLAYALSPRILTLLGERSIEAWPMALAPWILVPLVSLAHGGPLRPAVTRSAVAVGLIGGVNATAALAVLPPAVIWLALLRPAGRRARALLWWGAAVAAATLWWVVPLALLGRYGTPLLAYTETATATTTRTDAVSILRGASHWLQYHANAYGPWWPAGSELVHDPWLVLATLVVAAFGIAGLARRGVPHRVYLVMCLVVGVALVGLGHVTGLWGTPGGVVREFLDGPGAVLRNVHKFEPVVRLPLALGLAYVVGLMLRLAARAARRPRASRLQAVTVATVAVAAVAGAAAPALAGGLRPTGSFDEVPDYWRGAVAWLNDRTGPDRVLVLPAAPFGFYQWASMDDELTQPLLTVNHAVRNIVPMTPPGTIRLLDAIESAVATGAGSPGLADLLARSGIRYVLLRSDLDHGRAEAARPLAVRQALARSPGLTRVAGFGPPVGGTRPELTFIDGGLDVATQALEVYEVRRDVAAIAAYDLADVTTVTGGTEALLELAGAGLLGDGPTVLAGEAPAEVLGAGPLVITDSLRRREVSFGRLHDNTSETLTADAPLTLPGIAHDYLPAWADATTLTTAQLEGVKAIDASSSWAQAGLLGGSRAEHQPFAALDGDPSTSWRPATWQANEGQWIQVELTAPRQVPEVTIQFDTRAGAVPTRVTVIAADQATTVDGFGPQMTVTLPDIRPTRTVRVRVDQVLGLGQRSGSFGIAEIVIPGVRAERPLVVPPAPSSREHAAGAATSPATVVLSAAPSYPECYFLDDLVRCAAGAARGSEDGAVIDRRLTLPTRGEYDLRVWARPRPGPDLDGLLDREVARNNPLGIVPLVGASSTGLRDPAARPGVVVDGDPQTVWFADPSDTTPLLELTFFAPREVTGLRLTLPEGTAALRPGAVRAVGDSGTAFGTLDGNGEVHFDQPIFADDLSLLLYGETLPQSYNPYTNAYEPLAVGVGEVVALPDLPHAPVALDVPVDLPCGSGPDIMLNGSSVATRLVATRRDLLERREVPAQPCVSPEFRLSAGPLRVVGQGKSLAAPTRIALVPTETEASTTAGGDDVRVQAWAETRRQVHLDVAATSRVLAMRENTNDGWRATTADGQRLTPIVVDGWQQAWIVPAGVGGAITIEFAPDQPYRLALVVGFVLLAALVVLALIPASRPGRHHSAPPNSDAGGRAHLVLGAGGLVLAAGVLGAAVALLGLALRRARLRSADRRRRRRLGWRIAEQWLPVVAFGLGAWILSRTGDHIDARPQVLGLGAVALLWLSVCSATFAQPEQRPLQEVVARRRRNKRQRDDEQIGAEEVTGEARPAPHPVERLDDEVVPEKQTVGDRP